MKLLFSFLILSLAASAQTKTKDDLTFLANNNRNQDTTRIGLLEFDSSLNYLTSFQDCKPGAFDNELFEKIDSVLKAVVHTYNLELLKANQSMKSDTINLKRYSRQYMSAVSEKRGRLVWVNCFCTTTGSSTWPKPVAVSNGGNCYFNLLIHLDENRISNLKFNPEN